jgi:peptidoglycan/xylan/chitin deacetylase (PgdA/CDA1 family)
VIKAFNRLRSSNSPLKTIAYAVLFILFIPSSFGYENPQLTKISLRYANVKPKVWAENPPGVKMRLKTKEKVVALTLDACGSQNDGFDKKLINYLIETRTPATLFINSRWIDKNQQTFIELSGNPLFEIENHGWQHKPLSVNGKSVYAIAGTHSPGEVIEEIEKNAEKIHSITGKIPHYFRSGTAYYDDVAVRIVGDLGYEAVGFSVLGDKGATLSSGGVKKAVLSAKEGDIIICHMNHPEKDTAQGLIEAIPLLKRKGFRFVKLLSFALE